MSSFSELRKKRKGTTSPPKEPVIVPNIVPEPIVVKPLPEPPVVKPVPVPVPILDPAPIKVPEALVKRQRKQVNE